MTLVTNISQLMVVPRGPVPGPSMRLVEAIESSAILIEDGRIKWFGAASGLPVEANSVAESDRVDAGGGCVIPGLIDPHTHIPFVGDRAEEFTRRIGGESYLSIMESGGGIRVTTQAVREATEQQLVDENLPRLQRMLALGVTTCECKSGYGLAPKHELKQLHAIRELDRRQPIELIPTYLGAHALPAEFEGRADEFVDRRLVLLLLHRGLVHIDQRVAAVVIEHDARLLHGDSLQVKRSWVSAPSAPTRLRGTSIPIAHRPGLLDGAAGSDQLGVGGLQGCRRLLQEALLTGRLRASGGAEKWKKEELR